MKINNFMEIILKKTDVSYETPVTTNNMWTVVRSQNDI